MDQYDEISTLQYLGSKSRMLPYICNPIRENKDITTVVDLFAGTGAVGYALKEQKYIISNDLELYAYTINQAILNGGDFSSHDENIFFNSVQKIYNQIFLKIFDAVKAEEWFFTNDVDFIEYSKFCENTPSVFNPYTNDVRLIEVETLVNKITPGVSPDMDLPCLFLTYFSNTYFGIRQCCQIDAICGAIRLIEDNDTKNVLLTALMSVMSASASTTTHFAQYLKVKNSATCKKLLEKRQVDIIENLKEKIKEYRKAGLCIKNRDRMAFCYNMDFEDCLDTITLNPHTLVYADPPYFKEHYSRYYHVLNTVCLYDYPKVSINPQTGDLSIGRYRDDRTASDFGKKSKALGAFSKLVNKCADVGAWLILSYSDNSIVNIEDIQALINSRYNVEIKKICLNHSKQGRSSISKVDEYIFICKPQNDFTVDEKLDIIKNIKPIVDNPAGLMHNYMARKPYNIVSKIIELFCPEGGCVLDPMFGSGTMLIESSKLGRNAIGTDISLLAYNLCKVSLTKWNLAAIESLINEFVEHISSECRRLYEIVEEDQLRILERCHFDQIDGELIPTAYWYKTEHNGKLSGRKKEEVSESFIQTYKSFTNTKIECIENLHLIPNSRIAISENDTVHNYFCNRNLIAMDIIIKTLEGYKGHYGYEVLELIVSSAINLIKLSDKKASSQMPYWLPKTNVTSRNAVMIIEQKAETFKKGLAYLNDKCRYFVNDNEKHIEIENVPAQMLSKSILQDNSVDLILTDPPYADQVPYLEYSQLWFKVMGWKGYNDELLKSELVVSDSPTRKKDVNDFNELFAKVIDRIVSALKTDGYFVMFYHTFDLKSWNYILELMHEFNLEYCGQIPIPAPRKSFKTIMTPKATLDGNYIIVFQKREKQNGNTFAGSIEDAKRLAVNCAKRIIVKQGGATTQDLYDNGMLKESFVMGYLSVLAEEYSSFVEVIVDEFLFEDGIWRIKNCTGY